LDGILFAIGLLVLANSRPWEGFAVAVGLMLILGKSHFGWMGKPAARPTRNVMIGAGVVLAIGLGWMGYFNWRVTGKPLLMPYVLHERQYAAAPVLLIQGPVPMPHYRFPEMEAAHRSGELGNYTEQRSLPGFLNGAAQKIESLAQDFLFGSPLAIGFIWAGLCWRRDRRTGALLIVTLIFLGAFLVVVWHFSHYAGPGVPVMLMILILGLRHMRIWQRRRGRLGQTLFHAVIATSMLCYFYGMLTAGGNDTNLAIPRQAIINQLSQGTKRHVIFVKYLAGHDFGWEWVQNGADIDGSKIIWAHDMGDAENQNLLSRYNGRKAWKLEVGASTGSLAAYSP
jgi:hypothetical protein